MGNRGPHVWYAIEQLKLAGGFDLVLKQRDFAPLVKDKYKPLRAIRKIYFELINSETALKTATFI